MVAAALPVTDDQRQELVRIAGSSVLPHRQVVQAKALLWAADGVANEEIARRSGVDSDAVRRWRKRFADKGVDGVGGIAKGRGRKSWLPPDTVGRVDAFKISNDPEFEQKLVVVVGVYLKPPARAVVFSFDEKTQCQALDRTQPS